MDKEGAYTRDEEPRVDDIESVVGVRNTFDSVACFKLGVTGYFGPTSPIGSKIDAETRHLGEFGSHLDNPDC
jgi:hypothetical protein